MIAHTVVTLRWGIIGCGDVAEHKSGPALYQTPGSELIAVMRRDKAKAADFARRHGAKRWYADIDSLLADHEVNAIYVASPHHLHLSHSIQAAQAGKIVLCEKPMGTSSKDAQAIVDACKTNEVSLTVAYYRRFWPIVQRMKQLLDEDAIGRVVQARVQLSSPFSGDPERSWLTSLEEAGGGALANAGSHWVDLLRYLLGEIEDVTAFCSSTTGGFEVEDQALILLRTTDGALASLSTTWLGGVGVNDFDVTGTRGRLLANPLSAGRLYLHRQGKESEVFDLARSGPAHSELITEMTSRHLAGRISPIVGEEAVANWRIMEAAYRSAYRSSNEGCRIGVA